MKTHLCQHLEGVIVIHFSGHVIVRPQHGHTGILHPIHIFRVIHHED